MGIIKEFLRAFSFSKWEELGDNVGGPRVPKWVMNAFYKKRKGRSYGTWYFKGKTFLYKFENVPDVQGGSFHVYRKLRRNH